MATRGTRNTEITFGGFSIAVSLKKAATSRDIKTEVVNAQGAKVSSGGGGGRRALRAGESRAVRVSDDRVIRLPQDELDAIEEASKGEWEQMQVLECIDYRQVPTERIVESYWLQPAAGSAKGLALIAGALRETDKVMVVKWVATSREKLGVIRVRGTAGERALLLSELTFHNDFLVADDDALEINNVEVDERSHTVAVDLIEQFSRRSRDAHMIDTATDQAVDARLQLFERLAAQELDTALEETAAATGNVFNIGAARSAA